MNIDPSSGISEHKSMSSNVEDLNPEMIIEASKAEKVAKENIPVPDDSEAPEIEIGSAQPIPADIPPAPADPVPPVAPVPSTTPVNSESNQNQESRPPEKPKRKDWITVALTTSSAALGMLAVIATSFMIASCVSGINPFTFPVAIIVGLLSGTACGLTLFFREKIVDGVDKTLVNGFSKVKNIFKKKQVSP